MEVDVSIIPHVKTSLPAGGLDELLDRSWHPIVNAANFSHTHPKTPGTFPLRWAAFAPNKPEFLASLGRPLAIAKDLESSPGIWWLATPDDRYEYIIFSDCHRKNAWKGGQTCIAHKTGRITPPNEGLVALCRGFEAVWGKPASVSEQGLDFIECSRWFEGRSKDLRPVSWPRYASPAPPSLRP